MLTKDSPVHLLILLALYLTPRAAAQVPTPPGQPTTGPGGSDYLYAGVQKLGPYYSTEASEPYSSYYIFEPTGPTPPASLPVVLFLHGYFLKLEGYPDGDSPQVYIYWIHHLVRKGYTVVFPTYDYQVIPSQYTGSIIRSWDAALDLLQSGKAGLIPPSEDAAGLQTVFTGHSMGAYQAFSVAQSLTRSPVDGIPPPRAIGAFTPGIGNGSTLPLNFSGISPTISVVLVDGDEDAADIPTAQAIWSSIENVIPSGSRDFLQAITDSYGSPAQVGSHWFPDTNGVLDDDSGVDDRDYNITWKLSTGVFDCVLYGTNCSYGLGHGSTDQIDMGHWSDGTPVTPLRLQDAN